MIAFDFNGEKLQPTSTEEMGCLLDRVDEAPMFELWATVSKGPSLCMLRNGGEAWLMYLRQLPAFRHLGGKAPISFINAENEPSIRLATAVGAKHEKTTEFRGSPWQMYRHPSET